MEGGAGSSTL